MLHLFFGSLQSCAQPFAGVTSLEVSVISAGSSAQRPSQHWGRLENESTLISKAHLLILSDRCKSRPPFLLLQRKTTPFRAQICVLPCNSQKHPRLCAFCTIWGWSKDRVAFHRAPPLITLNMISLHSIWPNIAHRERSKYNTFVSG